MLSFTMSPAGRMHFALTVIVAELFLSLLNGVVHAAECRIVPIKPIHCVCGVVIDLSGGRISNAKVILLKGERKLVTKQTDANGKFSFEQMEAGTYEIQAEAAGFRTARSSVVVVKPLRKCKQAMQITLGFGFECDTGIALVRSKTIR